MLNDRQQRVARLHESGLTAGELGNGAQQAVELLLCHGFVLDPAFLVRAPRAERVRILRERARPANRAVIAPAHEQPSLKGAVAENEQPAVCMSVAGEPQERMRDLLARVVAERFSMRLIERCAEFLSPCSSESQGSPAGQSNENNGFHFGALAQCCLADVADQFCAVLVWCGGRIHIVAYRLPDFAQQKLSLDLSKKPFADVWSLCQHSGMPDHDHDISDAEKHECFGESPMLYNGPRCDDCGEPVPEYGDVCVTHAALRRELEADEVWLVFIASLKQGKQEAQNVRDGLAGWKYLTAVVQHERTSKGIAIAYANSLEFLAPGHKAKLIFANMSGSLLVSLVCDYDGLVTFTHGVKPSTILATCNAVIHQ